MIEQDPRITEGPTFFQSLYAWMKRVATEINSKAPLNSPALTGTPTAPTPPVPDNSTKIATTGWVHAAMASIATAAGFAAALGGTGYIKLPSWLGGLIIQWGSSVLTTNVGGESNISFPLAFPTGRGQVIAMSGDSLVNGGNIAISTIVGFGWDTSLSGWAFHAQKTDTNTPFASATIRVNWVVFGN
jgi:hypothetical protein